MKGKVKNAHVVSKLLNLYKFIKILAISEFDKEVYLCSALKCFQKIKFLKNLNLSIDGEIGGNLSVIGTATLNSLGLTEKANQMPRGANGASAPSPPKKHTLSVSPILQIPGGSVV